MNTQNLEDSDVNTGQELTGTGNNTKHNLLDCIVKIVRTNLTNTD
jgi:hypothetical protein